MLILSPFECYLGSQGKIGLIKVICSIIIKNRIIIKDRVVIND